VRAAISREHAPRVHRGRELAPYLRRLGNRDVLRLLGKLEAWFLRQYDIHHAAAMIQHADNVAKNGSTATRSCRATTRPTTSRRSRRSRARSRSRRSSTTRPQVWGRTCSTSVCAFEVAL
jgi:hypothetical protein